MFDMMPYAWNRSQNLLDSFADFEKNFFGEMSRSVSGFNTDIRDNGSEYVLEAELPGFNKEDIQVEVHDGMLHISAKHEEKQEEKDEKSGQYIRRERRYGSFKKSPARMRAVLVIPFSCAACASVPTVQRQTISSGQLAL